ncbi:MAG: phosphoribosylformylglycinamidine synthase subunit PurQ [Heliobacteriaceae bacterium]|jgi:phosphoribosylformylglycinamidine synthase|nr:phosphoribosylformylglycinamidine synthase subunit PurQ [Heliobacteriaceae bacterium]
MKAAVIVFPGTNCDRDTKAACEGFGWETDYVWHFEQSLSNYDAVFLPGGFSYGDYIRSGRLAKFSPVMKAVKEYVKAQRGFVTGICNGFQILCETGLLPGVLTDNWNTRFICKNSRLKIKDGKEITLPIAHGEGRYLAEEDVLIELNEKDMIFLTYADNPNGSVGDIAGLYDRERNIIGMMPHPERAFFAETGNTDGREIFKIIEQALAVKK